MFLALRIYPLYSSRNMILGIVFVSIITASVFIYRWLQEKYKYWEKLNIKTAKIKVPFGHNYEGLMGIKNLAEIMEEEHLMFPNEEMIGHYHYVKPGLILRNPELIEKVLIKDFSYFTDRFNLPKVDNSPLLNNLFTMTGNTWRAMRYKLSPLFTTGKLKYMFGPMSDVGENLTHYLESREHGEVDIKEINNLLAMDVIGSCAFGIDAGVLRNPSSTFGLMGKKMFKFSFGRVIIVALAGIFPKLTTIFDTSFIPRAVQDYFTNIIVTTMDERKKSGIQRNDFVQLFMQLKEKGSVPMPSNDPGDEYLEMEKSDEIQELTITDDILVSSAFTFLFAGFHTTATTLTYCFHELAFNQNIQDITRKEIQEKISLHGGITYEALKSMTYLDKVLNETMRLHPAVPLLFRVCTKEYTFPNGLKLTPGEGVFISVLGIQHDPEYYPEPMTFNPERFDEPPPPGTFLPFGEGPRICIAKRFALLKMKYAVAKILSSYTIEPSKNTQDKIKMEPRAFLVIPKGKVPLKIKKI